MRQTITTVVTRVSKDNDHGQARLRALAGRESDLQDAARVGYTLTHTAVIDTTDAATFVDTLTKNAD